MFGVFPIGSGIYVELLNPPDWGENCQNTVAVISEVLICCHKGTFVKIRSQNILSIEF